MQFSGSSPLKSSFSIILSFKIFLLFLISSSKGLKALATSLASSYNDEPLNQTCPTCGAIMLKNKNGEIYCSENCDKVTLESNDVLCPKCGEGHLVKRVASKGKSKGNEFYACNKYPKCKNIVTIEEYNKLLTN